MTIYKGQRIFQRNKEGEELPGQVVVMAWNIRTNIIGSRYIAPTD